MLGTTKPVRDTNWATYCYSVHLYRSPACRQYCQSDMHGRCLLAGRTVYVPCDPSTVWCLTRRLSIAASRSHVAAAAGPVMLPTRHLSVGHPHFYN